MYGAADNSDWRITKNGPANLSNPQTRFLSGGRVQGWQSVCWGMLGIPLLENKQVPYFVGFLFFGSVVSRKPNSDSCFPRNIDLMSKVYKVLLNGSSGLFGPCLFENCQQMGFRNFETYNNNMFINVPGFSWLVLCVLVSPKTKIIGFGGSVHVQKCRNHRHAEFSSLPSNR